MVKLANELSLTPLALKKALKGAIKFRSENPKMADKLFNDAFPLFIQINSIKTPKCPSKILRIPLKHSILKADSEVCLIVSEIKGVSNKDHEKHIQVYEELLAKKEVTSIKKIMTFHEFRTEYETFEMKRRLVELYDTFLVDGKICGKAVKKSGKVFYQKRKVPTAVKLQVSNLKGHIEQTLKKSPLYLHSRGDSFVIQFGHSDMPLEHLVENIQQVVEGLKKDFPGGFENIRTLNLYTFRGLTMPIYVSLKNQNDVVLNDTNSTEDTEDEDIFALSEPENSEPETAAPVAIKRRKDEDGPKAKKQKQTKE